MECTVSVSKKETFLPEFSNYISNSSSVASCVCNDSQRTHTCAHTHAYRNEHILTEKRSALSMCLPLPIGDVCIICLSEISLIFSRSCHVINLMTHPRFRDPLVVGHYLFMMSLGGVIALSMELAEFLLLQTTSRCRN